MTELKFGGQTWQLKKVYKNGIKYPESTEPYGFCIEQDFTGPEFGRIAHYLPTHAIVSLSAGKFKQEPGVTIVKEYRSPDGKGERRVSDLLLGFDVPPQQAFGLIMFALTELGWQVTLPVNQATKKD